MFWAINPLVNTADLIIVGGTWKLLKLQSRFLDYNGQIVLKMWYYCLEIEIPWEYPLIDILIKTHIGFKVMTILW